MKKFGRIAAGLLVITVLSIFCIAGYGQAAEDINGLSFYKSSTSKEPYKNPDNSEVENVILCIGDGMGLSQIRAAGIKAVGTDGKLYMEKMPVTGIVRTHSANSLVTDSAAAGTALACGIKTNNGMVGISPAGKKYQTILQAAKEKKLLTGLVVTSMITDATPACFGAHVESRKMEDKIAEQLLANQINVLFGGGKKYFLPKTNPESQRKDERDLIKEAKNAGYCYIETAEGLKSVQEPFVLGLFQKSNLTTNRPEPTLAELTEKAVNILNKKKNNGGFFLMVEGSQIDWACHRNDVNDTIKQTLCFDMAVKEAIDFAIRDKNTLVLVVADHETGGLAITGGDLKTKELEIKWAFKNHTALPSVLFAFGPGADKFSGVYDNTEIAKKLAELLNIKPFPRELN